MTENRVLVFDMDGTLADFFGVNGWLADLQNERVRPYVVARPLYDMGEFVKVLNELKKIGYSVAVTSWLSKCGSQEFMDEIRQAKIEWLDKYEFPYDEIHLVKYGTTKANCTRRLGKSQILFDDNEKIRKGWHLGETVDANENILDYLKGLLVK